MPDNDNIQTNMTLDDFSNILNIIDVASQRGVFRGDELSTVGGIRDRVASLVKGVQAMREQSNPKNEVSDSVTSVEENDPTEEDEVVPMENVTIN